MVYYIKNHPDKSPAEQEEYVENLRGSKILHYFPKVEYILPLLLGEFRFDKKGEWEDPHEKGKPRNPFNQLTLAGEKLTEKQKQLYLERMEDIQQSGDMLTSCWMMSEHESSLMWQGREHGACIVSKVDQFVLSLQGLNDGDIVCGEMKYCNASAESQDYIRYLFCKDVEYSGEQEFRFYLRNHDTKENYCNVRIDPFVMIDEIILGPACQKIKPMTIKSGNQSIKITNSKVKL